MNTTSLSPITQELVALALDYDLLQRSYVKDVATLRALLKQQHEARNTACMQREEFRTERDEARTELDARQRAYNAVYNSQREQHTQRALDINNLATTLVARDEKIASLMAERSVTIPTSTEIDSVLCEIVAAVFAHDTRASSVACSKVRRWFKH